MAALQQHVATIKSAYYTQDSRSLLAAFRLDPTTFSALQADLNKNVGISPFRQYSLIALLTLFFFSFAASP